MVVNSETVKLFVEANPKLVSKKETSIPGVFVLKYKNKCFYDNIWNDIIENTRGAVIDEKYNLIANPFRKIFNYGIEPRAPRIGENEIVTAIRKVNGFMLSVSWFNNSLLFSTTGSVDSDFVNLGKKVFYETLTKQQIISVETLACCGSTLLFEICSDEDPHIISEDIGAYFLGFRPNRWNEPVIPVHEYNHEIYGKSVGQIERITFGELKEQIKDCKHEGYLVYTEDKRATKIKSPFYLIQKFFARCNNTDRLLTKHIKESYPEEYFPLIDHIQSNVEQFSLLSEQDRLSYIRTYLESYLNEQTI
jgi:RNA ligase